MRDETPSPDLRQSCGSQLREALDYVERIIVDGLRHGFFEYSISCEMAPGHKRQLLIRAGKSHKFTIPEDELRRP